MRPAPGMGGDQVAATVGLCGRLPLAIQLTAGRLAQADPPGLDDVIGEWSPSPALLGGTAAASPEVIAAFDLSYRALEPGHGPGIEAIDPAFAVHAS